MKNFKIEISGKTQSDIEIAIQEVLRLVAQGYLSGRNGNDDGDFSFESSGDYEETEND